MALGVEKALADYLAAELGLGLYDHPDPALRVIFVVLQPPVPESDPAPAGGLETSAPLAITVFPDGGPAPRRRLAETYSVTVQVRHPRYEVARETAQQIHALLHEQGGAGDHPSARGRFGSLRIAQIRADFPPTYLGRDPAPRDGRALVTQTFTVRVLAPVVFA